MKVLSFNQISVMSSMMYLMMSMNLSDILILNINGANYRCIINILSKSEAVTFLQKADLDEKSVSDKISSGEKNCKYFIGCLYDDLRLSHFT